MLTLSKGNSDMFEEYWPRTASVQFHLKLIHHIILVVPLGTTSSPSSSALPVCTDSLWLTLKCFEPIRPQLPVHSCGFLAQHSRDKVLQTSTKLCSDCTNTLFYHQTSQISSVSVELIFLWSEVACFGCGY